MDRSLELPPGWAPDAGALNIGNERGGSGCGRDPPDPSHLAACADSM